MSFKFRKALALAVSIMMALSVVAVTVQADTVQVTDIAFTDKENSVDVTVTFTAPETASELTLLAATSNSVTTENIAEVAVGLDQFNNEGVGTVTFPMKKPTENTVVYVRMGGTGSASANLYSEEYTVGTTPPATDEWTVTFKVNGSTYHTAEVTNGETVAKPQDPEVPGFTFNYWELDGAEYNFKTPVTADITLTANLTSAATGNVVVVSGVTFADGADADTVDVTVTYSAPSEPAELTVLAAKTAEVTAENISEQAVGIDQFANLGTDSFTFPMAKPTEDTTIYVRMGGTGAASANLYSAEYKVSTTPPATDEWTVTFKVNDSTYQTQEVADGETASKPLDPLVPGYIFEGWELEGSAYDFETAVTTNITLTAKLTAVPVTESGVTVSGVVFTQSAADANKVDVVVAYAAPAGATAMNIAVATDESMSDVVYFNEFTHKDGTYTFTIDKPEVETLYVNMGGQGLESNGVYTAAYEVSAGTVQHKVTFVVTEGIVYHELLVDRGLNVAAITDPTMDGYTFAGWYQGDAEEPFNFTETPITEDIILTAKWDVYVPPVTYTVTFLNEEGGTVETVSVASGGTVTELPAVPEKEGYDGVWVVGETVFTTATVITDHTTVTPRYTLKSVYGDVTLDGEFNVDDVTYLLQALVGKVTLSSDAVAKADVTGDGEATIADAVKMLERIAEIIDKFPVEE